MGAPDGDAFAFDNERPRHKEWVEPFELGDRLVTVGELKAFLDEGGYEKPRYGYRTASTSSAEKA